MNKKFFTLVALLGMFMSFTAVAAPATPLAKEKGKYFHIVFQGDGTQYFIADTTGLNGKTQVTVGYKGDAVAAGDLALWGVEYKQVETTGNTYTYTLKNKASGAQFSYGDGLAAGTTDDDQAYKTTSPIQEGALNFAITGWDPRVNVADGSLPGIMYSFIPNTTDNTKDSTVFVTVADNVIYGRKVQGNKTSFPGALAVSFLKPEPRALTANELNAVLDGNGFQISAAYNKTSIDEAGSATNHLTGIRFIALGNGYTPGNNGVINEAVIKAAGQQTVVSFMAADKAPISKNLQVNYTYAYVDNVPYDAEVVQITGKGMHLSVDTLVNRVNNGMTVSQFQVYADPNLDNSVMLDSVNIYALNSYSYDLTNTVRMDGAGNDFTTMWAIQIARLRGLSTDEYVLTTADKGVAQNLPTTLSLSGSFEPSNMLDVTKVYSVKRLNKGMEDFDPATDPGYFATDLKRRRTMIDEPSVYMPSTQFVFNGYDQLTIREGNRSFSYLYQVKDKDGKLVDDTFTNGLDTLEVKAMAVDGQDRTVGYANKTWAEIVNQKFTFNYASEMLLGRAIDINADSIVLAQEGSGMAFKLIPYDGWIDYPFGPGVSYDVATGEDFENAVVQLERTAYMFYTEDYSAYLTVNEYRAGRYRLELVPVSTARKALLAAATSVERKIELISDYGYGTPFWFKATVNEGQYTMHVVGELYDNKYNVNSSTALVERVDNYLTDNAFEIKDADATPYVLLKSPGHYTFFNDRKEGMTRDTKDFGAFAFVDETKSDKYTEDDFKMWVDTASTEDPTRYLYYILKGAKAATEADSHELEGYFLRNMIDSIANAGYTQKVEFFTLPRVKFIEAYRYATGADSLLLNPSTDPNVKADSIGFAGATDANKALINQFRFAINKVYVDDEDNGALVRIENNAKAHSTQWGSISYVAVQNNVLYLTPYRSTALLVTMSKATSAPTSNDDAQVEEGVQVFVADGAVIVKGAAGKVVTINNVLGQTIAKRAATSDYDSFAVAGVAIVSVDGKVFKVNVY